MATQLKARRALPPQQKLGAVAVVAFPNAKCAVRAYCRVYGNQRNVSHQCRAVMMSTCYLLSKSEWLSKAKGELINRCVTRQAKNSGGVWGEGKQQLTQAREATCSTVSCEAQLLNTKISALLLTLARVLPSVCHVEGTCWATVCSNPSHVSFPFQAHALSHRQHIHTHIRFCSSGS